MRTIFEYSENDVKELIIRDLMDKKKLFLSSGQDAKYEDYFKYIAFTYNDYDAFTARFES